jgi:hypothetical protein
VLLVDVTQASEVSRLIREARHLNLPVEPGVREGRDALVRWRVASHAPPRFGLPYRGKQRITPNRSSWSGVRGRR